MNDMVLTIPEIILRLGIAMLFGGAIGFERQYKIVQQVCVRIF